MSIRWIEWLRACGSESNDLSIYFSSTSNDCFAGLNFHKVWLPPPYRRLFIRHFPKIPRVNRHHGFQCHHPGSFTRIYLNYPIQHVRLKHDRAVGQWPRAKRCMHRGCKWKLSRKGHFFLFIEISSYEVQTNIVKFLCPCASTGLDHGTLLICSPVLLVIGWRGRVAAHIRRRRSHWMIGTGPPVRPAIRQS